MQSQKVTLSDFRPQAENANAHSERGMGMLDHSMATVGWFGAMTTAADNEVVDGSARLETAYTRFGEGVEPITLEIDGTRPVVLKRIDIPNANHPKAKEIAIAANRVAEVNLAWQSDVLSSLKEEIDLRAYFFEPEVDDILKEGREDGAGTGSGELEKMTFRFTQEQADQVKAAIAQAKSMGEFDSENRDSEANAIARICETFLTQN